MRYIFLTIIALAAVAAPASNCGAQASTPQWKELLHCNRWCPREGYSCVSFHGKIWLLGGTFQVDTTFADLGDVWSTSDAKNWNLVTERSNWAEGWDGEHDVVFNDKIFSFAKSQVWSSPDGISWSPVNQSPPWGIRHEYGCAVFNDKVWVVGGQSQTGDLLNDVWSSEDGEHWSLLMSSISCPSRSDFTVTVFSGKLWILGGYPAYHDVWCSPDGLSWTQATGAAPWAGRCWLAAFAFNQRMWIAGGRDEYTTFYDVWSSCDGTTWVKEADGQQWAAPTVPIAVQGGTVYAVGDEDLSTEVWSSTNGRNWARPYSAASWPPCYEIGGTPLDEKLVMLGYTRMGNPLISSTDGLNWIQPTLSGTSYLQPSGEGYSCISFNKQMWVPASSEDGTTRLNSSPDGANWSSVPFTTGPTPLWGFVSASFKGEMYLLGGQQWSYTAPLSTVRHSPDGVNWSTYEAPWPGSWAGSGAVLGDKLYMFVGGTQQSWSTSDGLTWTRRNDVPWPARTYGMAVSSGDRIWVLGGQTLGGGVSNDVWYTTDGNTWTQFTANAPWYPRYDHFATFWNNKLWVIGGTTLNAEGPEVPLNDVWFMDLSGQPETFTVDVGSGWYTTGGTMTLTAHATNTTGPLTYQWFRDGQAISGATDATYRVDQAGESDSGSYTCQITTVYDPPHMTAPVPVTVFPPGALPGPKSGTVVAALALSALGVLARGKIRRRMQ